jgi:hypothetical protein
MTRLSRAFQALRKLGYLARRNYLCCSSCAGASLANEAERLLDAGAKPRGAVFYHRQDTEAFRDGHHLRIRFGQLHTAKHGDIGLETQSIGQEVMGVLLKCGVAAEWDGNPNTTIMIPYKEARR